MNQEELMLEVKSWVIQVGNLIKDKLSQPIAIEEKSDRHDLVTNVDKEIELFLIDKIKSHFPNDQIISEEGYADDLTNKKGRIWIIDPIDGTMNFIKQQENFCIMIGLFEGSKPLMGFIYDVIKDEFMYGGKETGVYLNETPFNSIQDLSLEDGLIGVNSGMFAKNILNTQDICLKAIGVRMLGCAGIEFLSVLTSKQNGYISHLAPWDFAAGIALATALGLSYVNLDGTTPDIFGGRQYVVVATPNAYKEIVKLL